MRGESVCPNGAAGGGEKAPGSGHECVGLALSGGWIRPASFSLEAMQALAGRGVLNEVDYLSTVCGG